MESPMSEKKEVFYFRPCENLSEEKNKELKEKNEVLVKALMYEDIRCIRKYNDLERLWALGEIAMRIYDNACTALSEMEIKHLIRYLDSSEEVEEALGKMPKDKLVDYMFEVAGNCLEKNNLDTMTRYTQRSHLGKRANH